MHKHTYRSPRFRTRVPFEPFRIAADTQTASNTNISTGLFTYPFFFTRCFHRIRCLLIVSKTGGGGRGREQPRSASRIDAGLGNFFLLLHDNCDISDPRIFQQIRIIFYAERRRRRSVEYAINIVYIGGKKDVN